MSAQTAGILPISQQSTFVLASLAYHGYEGVAFRPDEKPRLQATLNSYMLTYNRHIPQRALGHLSPVDALKSWREKKPELFRYQQQLFAWARHELSFSCRVDVQ